MTRLTFYFDELEFLGKELMMFYDFGDVEGLLLI